MAGSPVLRPPCSERPWPPLSAALIRSGSYTSGGATLTPARAPAAAAGLAPGGPDREIGILGHLSQAAPALLPVEDITFAGADISGEDGQARQERPVFRFLQDVAWVMRPGGEFVISDGGHVAQRPKVGKKACLIVAWSGRPHSPDLQLGALPVGYAWA